MAQEVKIGVSADTGSANTGLAKVETSVEGVSRAVRKIADSSRQAAAGLTQVEASARRVANARAMLSQALGRDVSESDASKFTANFDRIKHSNTSLGRRARLFDDETSWSRGISGTFTSRTQAAHHQRMMLAAGMQGTDDAQRFAPPIAPMGPDGVPGGRGGMSAGLGGRAMTFGRGALALAGIGSLMGMAAQSISSASKRAEGLDSMKRRMGDVGVNYGILGAQMNTVGARYGITNEDAAGLGAQYARGAGRLRAADMVGNGVAGSIGVGIGMSRAYGMDPSVGVDFMGSMRRQGITKNDQQDRKLATLIADAIDKGGFVGAAEEVLQAVENFTSQAARFSLSTPNVGAMMTSMASLMSKGYSGLDPAGAAALIGTADSAIRRGGGFGDASFNFNYQALQKWSPGMNVIDAKVALEGGLFGSNKETFWGNNPVSRFYTKNGIGDRPGMSSATNLDNIMQSMRGQYGGDKRLLLDAIKNNFGLSSYGQAAALEDMQDKGLLGGSMKLLGRSGVKLDEISGSGISTIAQISGATSIVDLGRVYNGMINRTDLTKKQKSELAESVSAAAKTGDFATVQNAMVKAVAGMDQEKTPAVETRDATKKIADALTNAGGPILSLLNPMRVGIDFLARRLGGGMAMDAVNAATAAAVEAGSLGPDGWAPNVKPDLTGVRNPSVAGFGSPAAPGGIPNFNANTVRPYDSDRVRSLAAMVRAPSQYDALFQAAGKKYGVDWRELKLKAAAESGLNPGAVGIQTSSGRALGMMQVINAGPNWQDPATNIDAGAKHYAEDLRKAKGDKVDADRFYYAGSRSQMGPNTHQYAANTQAVRALAGIDTPLPANDPGAAAARSAAAATSVAFEPAYVTVKDMREKILGQTVLKPVVAPRPAGGFPVRAGGY